MSVLSIIVFTGCCFIVGVIVEHVTYKMGARRQRAATPPVAERKSTFDPSTIPDYADNRPWEAVHLFNPRAPLPKRDVELSRVNVFEPALAYQCPVCDLTRAPLMNNSPVKCDYCGTLAVTWGTHVYFWCEPVEAEIWEP